MSPALASVLMVTYQYAPTSEGGAERQAQRLAEGLAARGRRVSVVTAGHPELPAHEWRGGVEVYRVWAVRRSLRMSATFLPSLARFLMARGRGFDIWHVHQAYLHAGIALGLARLLRKTCVVKAAASGPFGDLSRLQHAPLRWSVLRTLPWATAVVSLNAELSDELVHVGVSRTRIHLIPNGVDCSEFRPATSRERATARAALGISEVSRVALFAGRLAEDKGLSYLLDAWRILEGQVGDRPWHLLLAGDGVQAGVYRERGSRELKRARFLKRVDDMRPLLHAADLLVHASLTEGMSNIVLEAMASGLPVVGSMIPGIEELVDDGRTGLLVAPRDSRGLADAIMSLFTSPERMDVMGAQARGVAEQRFSLPAMLEAYEELYDRLTEG